MPKEGVEKILNNYVTMLHNTKKQTIKHN